MKTWMLVFLLAAQALSAAPAVQVREASLYAKPSALSTFLKKLPYGTSLTILEEQKGWSRIKTDGGLTGWIRTPSYTTKPLDLKATNATGSGVSSTEVSLAGRGFSEQIETEYKQNNPDLNFQLLDQMETRGVPDDQLQSFLRDGGLAAGGAR